MVTGCFPESGENSQFMSHLSTWAYAIHYR